MQEQPETHLQPAAVPPVPPVQKNTDARAVRMLGRRGERAHLERLRQNLYIAPDDPLYWQKRLRYLGNDFHTLFQMAEWKEQEGKLEQALTLYQRAEKAAKGDHQFLRAVYRRKNLQRRLASPPDGRPSPEFPATKATTAPTLAAPAPVFRNPATTVSRNPAASNVAGAVSGPVYTLQRAGRSGRWWLGLTGLLLGLVVGLLLAMGLVHYRLDVHLYHHPAVSTGLDMAEEEAAVLDRWPSGTTWSLSALLFPSSGTADSGWTTQMNVDFPYRSMTGGNFPPSSQVSPAGSASATGGVDAVPMSGEPGLTYLRTAVLGYYRLNGTFPEQLEALAGSFPDNYISGIPPDPVFGERKVVARWDGTGGWVYEKPKDKAVQDGTILETVARAVRPNWSVAEEPSTRSERRGRWWRAGERVDEPLQVPAFHPLQVLVWPDARQIQLVAGPQTWLAVTAAVGLPQTPTPTGDFFVRQRVWYPLGASSQPLADMGTDTAGPHVVGGDGMFVPVADVARFPYGVAGLEFADGYAIHGTDDVETLGQAVTGGCLRVDNALMAQLFAWTPLGTDVIVRSGTLDRWVQPEHEKWLTALYPRNDEHDATGVYFWKG